MPSAREEIMPQEIDGWFVPRMRASVAGVALDGEAVLYDDVTGSLHLLNPTATLIWSCCTGVAPVHGIVTELSLLYGVEAGDVTDAVLGTVRDFGRLGLLEGVAGEPARPTDGGDAGEEGEPCA